MNLRTAHLFRQCDGMVSPYMRIYMHCYSSNTRGLDTNTHTLLLSVKSACLRTIANVMANPRNLKHDQTEIHDKRKKSDSISGLGTCVVHQSIAGVVDLSVYSDGMITVTMITLVQYSIESFIYTLSQFFTRYPGLSAAIIPRGDDNSSTLSILQHNNISSRITDGAHSGGYS